MKAKESVRFVSVMGLVFVLSTALVQAGNCDLKKTDFGKTRQQVRDCQGKNCDGAKTDHDCGPLTIEITPNNGVGRVGQPFRIRMDSTQMCNGMTVKKLRGLVKWEAGSTCDLPDTYGFMDHVYATGGDYSIDVSITAECHDPRDSSVCKANGTARVHINP